MNTVNLSKSSKMYNKLFAHCQKQYKNIQEIQKAYIQNNQVYAIEYLTTCGIISLASDTYDADKVIVFN